MRKKILILKNDRGGDLLNSIKSISSLLSKENDVTICLSKLNCGFAFLFKDALIKVINNDLNFFNKIDIFYLILKNRYDEVYVLTPKNFYYFLPIFFFRIKFFAITIDGVSRNRPLIFLRKFLYRYITITRRKINKKSSSDLQLDLISYSHIIDNDLTNISLSKLDDYIKNNIPSDFLFIQYKENFFNKINLNNENFKLLVTNLNQKHKYIVFSSDIENTKTNEFFLRQYSFIDCTNKKIKFNEINPRIIYLHKINSENLFALIKNTKFIISPHGLLTHISRFYKKNSINLFNIIINNKNDVMHHKIAFSEWYKNSNMKFLFLDTNINRSLKKILKNL
jgi:ADP-heptose:LPS heptosyltransferase